MARVTQIKRRTYTKTKTRRTASTKRRTASGKRKNT